MSMTIAQAKSELMQIYGALSPDKQRAIDTLVKASVNPQEPCEDAIDRAEAMTVIMMFAGNVKSDEENIYIKVSDAVQLLRELPSVNPQPKTGHWAHDGSYWKYRFICSECNYRLLDKPTNYCPNCGCKMEREVRNESKYMRNTTQSNRVRG